MLEGVERIIDRANEILNDEGLVKARRNYIQKNHYGNESQIDITTYVCFSAFTGDPLHEDVAGTAEAGKSNMIVQSLALLPQDKVKIFSELSPKHLYYESKDTDFTDHIIYIDDNREEHIGLLKSMRNEADVPSALGTVVDGKAVSIKMNGNPVVIASSVLPNRDLGGQGTSRAFLVSIEKPDTTTEQKVHEKIRQKVAYNGLNKVLSDLGLSDADLEKTAIIEATRMLRDEGIRNVSIPFDAPEPDGTTRRDTNKFMKLILVSAFIHQRQRPILYINDKPLVLAIQEDLLNALKLYDGLGLSHKLRITDNGMKILRVLPTEEANAIGTTEIADRTGIKSRTLNDNLNNLYSCDLINRIEGYARGSPLLYWIDKDLSEMISAENTDSSKPKNVLGGFKRKAVSLKTIEDYGEKYVSDDIIKSIYKFFFVLSGLNEEIRLEYMGETITDDVVSAYIDIFAAQNKNEPTDSDVLSEGQSAQIAENIEEVARC